MKQKHDVADALFLVDGAPWLQTALDRHGLDFGMKHTEIEPLSNVSIENENAERLCSRILLATTIQQPPKTGCSLVRGGTIRLTKHEQLRGPNLLPRETRTGRYVTCQRLA